MMRRLANRIGVAVVVAAVFVSLGGPAEPAPERAADETWAISWAASYWGNMDRRDEMVFDFTSVSVCAGYGYAASFAFTPLGGAGFGMTCALTLMA